MDKFWDLINSWLISPINSMVVEIVNKQFGVIAITNVLYVERFMGIPDNIVENISRIIMAYALVMLSFKLIYKYLNVYHWGLDGDETVSPISYLKSYGKGVVIILLFTEIYSQVGNIVIDFTNRIIEVIGEQSWQQQTGSGNIIQSIFFFVYMIFLICFFVSYIISGIRMLFLRLAVPLSCIGLIDNDNGIYSIFIKKLTQNLITVVAQIAMVQLSMLPIQANSNNTYLSALTLLQGIACLYYATKLPQDLNEIFLVSPQSGAGQKLSFVGQGIQNAVTMLRRA